MKAATPAATSARSAVPSAGAADEGITTEHRAPPPREPRKRRRQARATVDAPTFDTVVTRPDDGVRIEVSARLVARARAMAPTLPSEVLGGEATEEAVLKAALRLGLAALAALSDED